MSMRSIAAALAMMSGGMGGPRIYIPETSSADKRRYLRAKMTKAEKVESFITELATHNKQKAIEFPKWRIFMLDGFPIISSNPKTARKTLTFLLATNCLTTTEGLDNTINPTIAQQIMNSKLLETKQQEA